MPRIKPDMYIGDNMRLLRKSKGFTQDMLIAKLHTDYGIELTRSQYSRMETNELNIPISVLVALHKLYKCSYDEFFNGLDINFD